MTMRWLGLALLGIAACGDDGTTVEPDSRTFELGTLTLPAHTEDLDTCVVVSLGNDEPLYINEITLTTGPGFHHSNWLWVPSHYPPETPDGIFSCDERNYDQTAAGVLGGVFFAQSTQSEHEVQKFPEGVALALPPRARLVAQLHLLNNNDEDLVLTPTIGYRAIPKSEATTSLQSLSFEYHPLGLPPRKQSRFTMECDVAPKYQELLGRQPDFSVFYALAHYHEWGTGLTLEAVRADGGSQIIYSTENNVGDVLGGPIEPSFAMAGFTKLRLTCNYYNNTDRTITYGNGDGEMCVFNAFSNSSYTFAGGALDSGPIGTPVDVGGVATFTQPCSVYAIEGKI
jgi:hypothetical protein